MPSAPDRKQFDHALLTLLLVADRTYNQAEAKAVSTSDAKLLDDVLKLIDRHERRDRLQDLPNRHVARRADIPHDAIAEALLPELDLRRRGEHSLDESVAEVVRVLVENRLLPDPPKVEKRVRNLKIDGAVESNINVAREIVREAAGGRFQSAAHLAKVAAWFDTLPPETQRSLRASFYFDDLVGRDRLVALGYALQSIGLTQVEAWDLAEPAVQLARHKTSPIRVVAVHGEPATDIATALKILHEESETRTVLLKPNDHAALSDALTGDAIVLLDGLPEDLNQWGGSAGGIDLLISLYPLVAFDPDAASAARAANKASIKWIGLDWVRPGEMGQLDDTAHDASAHDVLTRIVAALAEAIGISE